MLDWPEQIQTSPTRISFTVTVSRSLDGHAYAGRRRAWPAAGPSTCPVPSAVAVALAVAQRHGDFRAGCIPTPDRQRLIALQHHVVADDRRQLHGGVAQRQR